MGPGIRNPIHVKWVFGGGRGKVKLVEGGNVVTRERRGGDRFGERKEEKYK